MGQADTRIYVRKMENVSLDAIKDVFGENYVFCSNNIFYIALQELINPSFSRKKLFLNCQWSCSLTCLT